MNIRPSLLFKLKIGRPGILSGCSTQGAECGYNMAKTTLTVSVYNTKVQGQVSLLR